MDEVGSSGRLPIRKLLKPPVCAPQEFMEYLSRRFDTFQAIETASLDLAIGFSLLEHLLRPTMLAKERTAYLSQLPAATQSVVAGVLETCQSVRNPLESLQQWLSDVAWEGLRDLPQVIRVMRIDKHSLVTEQIVQEGTGPTPISYILSGPRYQVLLYTPTMTFIDGFDPTSGKYKPSITPSLLVKRAKSSLFSSSHRRPKTKTVQLVFSDNEVSSDDKTTPSSRELRQKQAEEVRSAQRKLVPLSASQRGVSETQAQGCCASSCSLF